MKDLGNVVDAQLPAIFGLSGYIRLGFPLLSIECPAWKIRRMLLIVRGLLRQSLQNWQIEFGLKVDWRAITGRWAKESFVYGLHKEVMDAFFHTFGPR